MLLQKTVPKRIKQEFERVLEEATVDCYDEEDVFSGVVCTLEDELQFPFDAVFLHGNQLQSQCPIIIL